MYEETARRVLLAAFQDELTKIAAMSPHERLRHAYEDYEDELHELRAKQLRLLRATQRAFKDQERGLGAKVEAEFDRFSHDIGPMTRARYALQSGAVGAGLGALAGDAAGGLLSRNPAMARRGRGVGALLGGLGLAGVSAVNHHTRIKRHKARMAGKEKKASALEKWASAHVQGWEDMSELEKQAMFGKLVAGARRMMGAGRGAAGANVAKKVNKPLVDFSGAGKPLPGRAALREQKNISGVGRFNR